MNLRIADRRFKIAVVYREFGDTTTHARSGGIHDAELNPACVLGCELATVLDRAVPNPMAVLAEAINTLADGCGPDPPDELSEVDEALIRAARAYCRAMGRYVKRHRQLINPSNPEG